MTRFAAWCSGVRRGGTLAIAAAIVLLSLVTVVLPAASQNATLSPAPSASASASPAAATSSTTTTVARQASGLEELQLGIAIWLSTLLIFTGGIIVFLWLQGRAQKTATPTSDGDVDMARISYGFWLVISGLLLTLAVVIVTMFHFRGTSDNSQIVAIVTAVTGVIGTLTAAFFGIQAAGAGQTQALRALSNFQAGANAASYTMSPSYGPHDGNTTVTISGNNLTNARAVNFGTKEGSNFRVSNDGLIYVNTPPVELDTNATTQTGKSDVDVAVVFPPGTPNVNIGTFYYYTVRLDPDKQNLVIYGSGLGGVSAVKFGPNPPVTAHGSAAGVTVPVADVRNLKGIWHQDVEIALIYAADSAAKTMIIGKFRIPPEVQEQQESSPLSPPQP